MDNFLSNTFSIAIQPKQNFHFRYVSELQNTHGVITGQQNGFGLPPADNVSVTENIYPSVRLLLSSDNHLDEYGNKRDFFVLCSLHSYSENGPQALSPHLLMAKGDQSPTYDFIFAPMEENIENPLERCWQLKDYVIVRLKVKDFHDSLLEKKKHCERLKLPQAYDQLKGSLDLDKVGKENGTLNVCLGFTIYEYDFYTKEYRLYKETIYSDNIFHGDDLRIHKLCNTKGPLTGGTEVTILIKLCSGYKYDVHMFKYSRDRTSVVWEEYIPGQDIFGNTSISFKLPPGPSIDLIDDDETEVIIEVVVNRTTYKSQGVKFWYTNNNTDNESGKRKRPRTTTNNLSTAPIVTEVLELPNFCDNSMPNIVIETHLRSSMDLQPEAAARFPNDNDIFDTTFGPETEALLDSLLNNPPDPPVELPYYSCDFAKPLTRNNCAFETPREFNKTMRVEFMKEKIDQILREETTAEVDIRGYYDGSTMFHDALADTTKDNRDPLIYIYRLKNDPILKKLILKARNNKRQNLLHFACNLNKPYCLKPLIGIGVGLHEQDCQGRTPLHIAIEQNHEECLQKFKDLLENHSEYSPEVKDQLIKMFQVYSHKGHTVLHAAVVDNHMALLEVMFKFCQRYNLDIFEYEALGNGDSIAHLMAKRNLLNMVSLLRKYAPGYISVKNYPGQTVLDLPELSEEMLNALKGINDHPELSQMLMGKLNIN